MAIAVRFLSNATGPIRKGYGISLGAVILIISLNCPFFKKALIMPTKNWDYYKKDMQHSISAAVTNLSRKPESINFYLQKYDFHPFIDVYVMEGSKDTGFHLVLSEISTDVHDTVEEEEEDHRKNSSIRAEDVLYLGDAENDNPAFRKVGLSI